MESVGGELARLLSAQDAIVVWTSWHEHRLWSYGEQLDRSGSSCKALAATTDFTCAEQAESGLHSRADRRVYPRHDQRRSRFFVHRVLESSFKQ